MPSLDLLLPFLAATLIFAVMPGPALLYTATQTMAHGRRRRLMAVFMTGTVLMRLKRSSRARIMIQMAGGSVLIGLGAHLAIART